VVVVATVAIGGLGLLRRSDDGGDVAAPSTTTTVEPTPAFDLTGTGSPALGAYVAPSDQGGIEGLVRFGDDVGRQPTFAMAYLDARSSWPELADPAWLLDPWTAWLKADSSRRLVLAVPMLQVESAGQFEDATKDRYFVELAQSIVKRGIADRVVIRLGYEMNSDWATYGRQYDPDGAGFRTMWRRVVTKMRAVHPFVFDWSVVPTEDPAEAGFAEAFYPGDDVVDVIGLDVFDHWVAGTPEARWQALAAKVGWAADFAAAHHKPLALDEWAVWSTANALGGGDDPTYITNLLGWASDHHLVWISYFNSKEGQVDTTLEENPESLAAFRTYLASR
jgi:hypothetical protein